MSHQLPGTCSPLRDKRRQSDAKWRASVATCYDVLKYAVPNVKQMSKKKISKALILQECEKHIQDLEDTISYLLHVECKNQGRIAVWTEGDYWSQCSVEKLHKDFTEKQRRVFHESAHGRRCYNLLQDIKEEVFDMKADSQQIKFIREDSLNLVNSSEKTSSPSLKNQSEKVSSLGLVNQSEHVNNHTVMINSKYISSFRPMNSSENVNDGIMKGTHTVSILPISVDSKNELVAPELSQTTIDESPAATENDGDGDGQAGLHIVPSSSLGNTKRVRQQPRPRKRFVSDSDGDIDTALLQGPSDGGKHTAAFTNAHLCEPADLLFTESAVREKQNGTAGIPAVSPSSGPSASSASPDKRSILENADNLGESDGDISGDSPIVKLDQLSDSLYGEKDYPFLVEALQEEKEQEVPSMETPVKTTKIKRPRLSGDIDILSDCCGITNKDAGCVPELNISADSSLAGDSMYSKCYTSHSVGSRDFTLTPDASLMLSSMSDIKVETEDASPCINNDPMLSSLNTPKFDADMALFFWTPSDGVTKQLSRYGSARKKLNFNSPSYSGWSHTSPGFVHPDRAVPSFPVVTGFTPVKLPDDLTRNSDASSEYVPSPWKSVNSPFNSRTMAQGYINSSTLVDPEDNLFCMETLDSLDFEDGFSSEVTPCPMQHAEKTQRPEDLLKSKGSFVSDELTNRMKPPCRKRLERFYDHSAAARNFVAPSDESQVVPRLDMNLWTSEFYSQQDCTTATELEQKLICLETDESLELDDDS